MHNMIQKCARTITVTNENVTPLIQRITQRFINKKRLFRLAKHTDSFRACAKSRAGDKMFVSQSQNPQQQFFSTIMPDMLRK